MRNYMLLLALIFAMAAYAQVTLPNLDQIDVLYVKSYWGNVNIKGVERSSGTILGKHSASTGSHELSTEEVLERYLNVEVKGRRLEIISNEPNGFESLDIYLKIPKRLVVEIEHIKGGEISLKGLHNGVEVNQRNGSLIAKDLRGYAMVNLANGSIDVEFDTVSADLPISLVTMNGGIIVRLPSDVKRDVRLISRKNGYIWSEHELVGVSPIKSKNTKVYSKTPISETAYINGGGAPLFLSTENGPLTILKK